MSQEPLHYRPITSLTSMLRSGEITPTALTVHLLERIEALNGPLNAFNLVTADRAMAMAEARAAQTLLRSGRDRGPSFKLRENSTSEYRCSSGGLPFNGCNIGCLPVMRMNPPEAP
ncbi:MAG: hypothetical protein AAF417_23775 [Pseudomonadota bacterium]